MNKRGAFLYILYLYGVFEIWCMFLHFEHIAIQAGIFQVLRNHTGPAATVMGRATLGSVP